MNLSNVRNISKNPPPPKSMCGSGLKASKLTRISWPRYSNLWSRLNVKIMDLWHLSIFGKKWCRKITRFHDIATYIQWGRPTSNKILGRHYIWDIHKLRWQILLQKCFCSKICQRKTNLKVLSTKIMHGCPFEKNLFNK